MSELERVEDEVLQEQWCRGWSTTGFHAATAGTATLSVDGDPRVELQIVGWLHQEEVAVERSTGEVRRLPTMTGRIVPGFLGSTGAVVPIEVIEVRSSVDGGPLADHDLQWKVRIGGTSQPITIVVQPAEVVVMPEPATRRVIRDQYGNIDKVVAE